jgi:transcription initiation factor TFIIIB Brf1 subunit/transcription initiation factor TFIIB
MSQIRISRPALDEVEQALRQYESLLAKLRAERVIRENTQETYLRYAEMFVRWLRAEFDPGARNK